ncbi:MAG: hypothetical protein ABEJ96_10380, partial [Thiohalorhabdaceae bacterium]
LKTRLLTSIPGNELSALLAMPFLITQKIQSYLRAHLNPVVSVLLVTLVRSEEGGVTAKPKPTADPQMTPMNADK